MSFLFLYYLIIRYNAAESTQNTAHNVYVTYNEQAWSVAGCLALIFSFRFSSVFSANTPMANAPITSVITAYLKS